MSYDISLKIKTGEEYFTVYSNNYTYNVGPMYALAFGGNTVNGLNNMLAKDAVSFLEQAIGKMETFPEEYKALNPENGWGNYEGALKVLKDLLTECKRHPETTIDIS